jgi:streptogramin lyase
MLVAAAVILPGATDARPRLGGVFDLSGTPGQIARGPDGNIWVILKDSDDNEKIARIRPNGNVTEFAPAELNNPVGITPSGNNLWFTQANEVVRVDPDDPEGSNEAFTVNALVQPQELIKGPNNRLWTASGDQLVSFTAADPEDFDAKTITDMNARGIAASGGRLWIADFAEGRIVRVTPGAGTKFFKVGGAGPQDVAKGPKKGAAYTNQGTDPHTVGRIVRGRKVRRTKVPNTDPFGITFASDKRWWIANFASHDLTILERDGDKRKFRKLPDDSGPRYITGGPNKTLWVSLELSDQVARIKGVRR